MEFQKKKCKINFSKVKSIFIRTGVRAYDGAKNFLITNFTTLFIIPYVICCILYFNLKCTLFQLSMQLLKITVYVLIHYMRTSRIWFTFSIFEQQNSLYCIYIFNFAGKSQLNLQLVVLQAIESVQL